MLAKLLKYEFKATSRVFLLMYAALLLVAAVNATLLALGFSDGAFSSNNQFIASVYDTISGLALALYIVVILAVVVLTEVVLVVRFYRMLGDEGYLWFTLPATVNQHILSKLVVAVVWSLVSILLVVVSIALVTVSEGWIYYLDQIPLVFSKLVSLGFNPLVWMVLLCIMLLTAVLSGMLMLYTAMSIGPNLTKSRLGGSVLAYIIIYVVLQVLTTIEILLMTALPFRNISATFVPAFDSAYPEALQPAMVNIINEVFFWTAGAGIVGALVVSVAYYFITRHFLTKKLNLQ